MSERYALKAGELKQYLKLTTGMLAPTMLWGPAGVGKSAICQQVAEESGAEYIDIRAILLDPVDLRGIPYRDNGMTRWAPPNFLPPENSTGKYLIALEELPTAPPVVQAALYQLALDRRIGEYALPPGASVVACGNREIDGGVFNRFSPALASRFYHVELEADVEEWKKWAIQNGVAPQVIFFLTYRPDLLQQYDPRSKARTFPCPRTWEFVSNIVKKNGSIDPDIERSVYVGLVGESAAIEFTAFLRCWRELPHPNTVISDPKGVDIPENTSSAIALCGALYRMATESNFDEIVTFAKRLRVELGEYLVSSVIQRDKTLQHTRAYIEWASHVSDH